jgi:cytochrome b subunit of formate dehydrogenase
LLGIIGALIGGLAAFLLYGSGRPVAFCLAIAAGVISLVTGLVMSRSARRSGNDWTAPRWASVLNMVAIVAGVVLLVWGTIVASMG